MKRKSLYRSPVIEIKQMFGVGVDALMTSGIAGNNSFDLNGYDDSDFDLS